MSEYTPTTDDVRQAVDEWVWARRILAELPSTDGAEFDRWLAEVKAEVLREAADDIEANSLPSIKRNDMNVRFAVMLRARADELTP